ncbi:MAG: DUF748 domain-containing protein [Desulfobacterota bacterium]|nr:DUF748 domain-containing protein [Thermodesulfobacteriota bacterium]
MFGRILRIYENKIKPHLKKILIGAVLFFVLFTLVGFFAIPPLLKSILIKILTENLHREVAIRQVKINPYTLSVTVRGLQVKERQGSETFFSFDELYINLQSLSALRWALILKEIRLTKPYLRISRNEDETYNFSDLLEKKEAKSPETPAEKPKPLRFSLNNIRLIDGSIDFWDGPKKTKHTVRELNIGLPFLSNIPAYIDIFVRPAFSAKVNETPYRLQGNTKPFRDTLETVFDININDLDLPYYLAYLPMKLNVKIVSAFLDVQTKISFIQHRDKQPSLTVTGNVALKKVALDDLKKNPLFRLPLLTIGIAPTEPLRMSFHLSKVSIQSPDLDVKRNAEGALNIEAFLPEKKEMKPAPATEKKADQPLLSLDIDEVELTGGKVSFSDGSTKRPFKTVLTPVELKVAPFSNRKDKKTAYSLSITSEVKETIKLEGELTVEPLWAEGRLEIRSVPLAKYSPYYQDRILFNLEEGHLDFSTRFKYAQREKEPDLSLSAMSVLISSLRLKREAEKEDFLNIPVLSVKDTLVDVTQKNVTIGAFSTEKGRLIFNRLKNGELDLMKLLPSSPPEKTPPEPEKGKGEEKPWALTLKALSVDQYTIRMGDQTPSEPITLTAEKITIRGENLSTAKNVLGKLSLSLLLDKATTLSTKNTIGMDPLQIEGSLEINRLVLNQYAPYYQDQVLFKIAEGELDLSTSYQYRKTDKEAITKLSGLAASLKNLKLKKKGEEEVFVDIPSLIVKNTSFDLPQREISVGDFSTQNGSLLVRRLKDGKINLMTLFPEPAKKEEKSDRLEGKPAPEKALPAEKPWLVRVGKVSVEGYTLIAEDQTLTEPVRLIVDEFRLRAENLSTAQGQKGNVALALRLNQKGTFSTEGTLGIDPLAANLKVGLKDLEIKPFQPYFTDKVKITITDGSLNTTGNVILGMSDKKEFKTVYSGKASLIRFASIDKKNAEDFLKLESLALEDLRFDSDPFSLDIGGIALSNFYARVVVQPEGVLNLQQIFGQEEVKKEPPAKKEAPPAPSAEKKPAGPPKAIKIGTVTLQGGQVDFLDRSVQPEYSTRLMEIGGRISGLSSEETSRADLELRTKLDGFAPLEITGKINPLKEDLYVDLKARFKDMELSPLTPYSGKYVGYTVEKGKLSFDLSYLIDKRKLDAKNEIFIDQFNFGEKVESPQATKLPVKLAVALLKDRKGEIKLDIPVSGSLDDPKFSIWGIILKILVNLIVKAATSPFALLGAIVGGGEELSFIEFDYGSAALHEPNAKKLNAMAKALNERPGLKLDIVGHVDVEKDREGLKQLFFQRKLKAQKLKEIIKKGGPPVPVDDVKIEKQEYEKYLKLAYKEERFPKPKNVLGLPKDLPAPEMEKLILTHLEIKEGDLRTLASQRAMAVKEAIVKAGPVEPERIFLLEPKSLSPEKKEKLKESRVELKIK